MCGHSDPQSEEGLVSPENPCFLAVGALLDRGIAFLQPLGYDYYQMNYIPEREARWTPPRPPLMRDDLPARRASREVRVSRAA